MIPAELYDFDASLAHHLLISNIAVFISSPNN
jgi:hypothetical protein